MPTAIADKIVRSIEIEAPRERVWRALTTEKEFAQWFGVRFIAGEFKAGARVTMTSARPGCEYEGIEWFLAVERMDAPRLFSWRWSPGQTLGKNEPLTLVEFVLEETKSGTRVTITETGFDRISLALRAKALEENSGGWDHQTKSLAEYVAQTR